MVAKSTGAAFDTRRTRRAAISGLAGFSATILAACGAATSTPGGDSETTGAGGAPAAKQPVTIRLGERAGTEEQAFDARLPVFADKYPHITVVREPITGNMIQKLQTMAVSNTLPDNVHCYTGDQSYHNFSANGAFIRIDDHIARDKLDLKGWFPEMVDMMRIDGRLHGLPFKGQVLTAGFFYNINLFEQGGAALPTEAWTLDDLVKAAEKLTVRQGGEITQYGYAIQTWGGENFVGHLRQWNGDSFSPDGKKATMDTPQVLEALQWYETMFNRQRILHPLADASNHFIEGKVAMIGRTYLNYKTAAIHPKVQDSFKWNGVLMPKHAQTGKRGGMFAGDAHAVTRDSKSPDAAFELLKWVTDKEFGVALGLQTKGSTTLGGRPDVYADSRILNHPDMPKQAQVAQLKSVKEIKEPYSVPWNFRAPEVYKVRDPVITKIANGEAKAEPGLLAQLNAEMQVILDMPRP
ncbi:MAG: ABC transporter substrate-binding protein [Chloroflexota bacterium]